MGAEAADSDHEAFAAIEGDEESEMKLRIYQNVLSRRRDHQKSVPLQRAITIILVAIGGTNMGPKGPRGGKAYKLHRYLVSKKNKKAELDEDSDAL